ncbi:MAG: toxin [Candidatus Levybacteria bacterium]|nr:toxin [Candidatus Levybacteria bacterium]
MKYKFDYSLEKNQILIRERGVGFEDIIDAIESGGLIENKKHPNQKRYQGQKLFIVKIDAYIYVVPYIFDRKRQVYFLKTLYPNRKLTKQYFKTYEKEKI